MLNKPQSMKMAKAIIDIQTKTDFIPSSITKRIFIYLSPRATKDYVEALDGLSDLDLGINTKTLLKKANIDKAIKLIESIDETNAGQVYLGYIIVGFYNVFVYQMHRAVNNIPDFKYNVKTMESLGYTKSTDKRFAMLVKLINKSPEEFKAIEFNNSQLAYLRAAVIKMSNLV